MPNMTDPFSALVSFQAAFKNGKIDLQQGEIDKDIYVHQDAPLGKPRLTYVKFENKSVCAFANFSICDPVDAIPCFQIGYAVPEKYRNKGKAKDIVTSAISELKAGLVRNGAKRFYIEAIISADNLPSQHVAKSCISTSAIAITDELSGQPAFQYLREMTA